MATTKPVTVEEYLRYTFSPEEIQELAQSLAMNVQRQQATIEEQKAAAAQFKDRIEGLVSSISRLSRSINNGWEMRNIVCRVMYHTPTQGTKRIVREDTGEVVRECAMSKSEMQEQLFSDNDFVLPYGDQSDGRAE